MDFKDILSKLEPLKNKAILTPLLITLAAMVLLVPTQLMSGRLKTKIQKDSVSILNRLKSIDPVSQDQWQIEKEFQDQKAADANMAELLAIQSTQRELLGYRVFPEPASQSQMIFENYAKAYRAGIEQMLAAAQAKNCPLELELDHALEKAPSSSTTRRSAYRKPPSSAAFGSRRSSASQYMSSRLSATEKTIIDLLCNEKAQTSKVYADASSLVGYDFWAAYQYTGTDAAVSDCWYHQLAYWVVEDAVTTVRQMNVDAGSVLDAPVKRLMRVAFTLNLRNGRRGGGRITIGAAQNTRGRKGGNIPSYVKTLRDGLTDPCTGRLCDESNHVVHFNISVIISADAVVPFMRELCSGKSHIFKGWDGEGTPQTLKHNQISILESSTKAVSRDADEHLLYRYGQNAVVELDMICEYLLHVPAYEPIIPELIKTDLAAEATK